MSLDLHERHRRFWRREQAGQVLVGESREGSFFLKPFLDLGIRDGLLRLGDVPTPEAFVPSYFEPTLRGDARDGDLYWVPKPPRALPWMEAIAGCSVHVSANSLSMKAVAPEAVGDLAGLDLGANGWLGLMTAFTRNLAFHFGERFPIGQTLMRGPSDMLAALLGPDFYTGLLDDPASLRAMAGHCASIWIRVLEAQYRHIPPFHGGVVSGMMGLWAPGPIAVFQEDAAGYISERMYREVFQECDRDIAAAFPYSLLHLHSAALHILEAVLEIAPLTAVNVVIDPIGPPLPDLLPRLRRVQEAGKALHLHGDLSAGDVRSIVAALSPDGLCLSLVRGP